MVEKCCEERALDRLRGGWVVRKGVRSGARASLVVVVSCDLSTPVCAQGRSSSWERRARSARGVRWREVVECARGCCAWGTYSVFASSLRGSGAEMEPTVFLCGDRVDCLWIGRDGDMFRFEDVVVGFLVEDRLCGGVWLVELDKPLAAIAAQRDVAGNDWRVVPVVGSSMRRLSVGAESVCGGGL